MGAANFTKRSSVQVLTLCDEEVEHGEYHCVTAEHVVATRVYSRQAHPKTAPDGDGSLQFGPHVAVDLKEERKDGLNATTAPCPKKEAKDSDPPFLSTAGAAPAPTGR